MPESVATLSLVGRDDGLAAVLGSSVKALERLAASAIAGGEQLANYAASADAVGESLGAIAASAVGAADGVAAAGAASNAVYQTVTVNANRTITAADVLNNKFAQLALSVAGLGDETFALNAVLQPTAAIFSQVADQSTFLGKAFAVIDIAAGPVVATLSAASGATADFAQSLAGLGDAGKGASELLLGFSDSLQTLSQKITSVDKVGQLYTILEKIKEVLPDIIDTTRSLGGQVIKTGGGVLSMADNSMKMQAAVMLLSHTTTGLVKVLADLYQGFSDLQYNVEILKNLTGSFIQLTLQVNNYYKALEDIENLGVSTNSAQIATSLGVVGEGLIFNAGAAKKFGQAATAAFAQVQDSLAFVTTLPAGLQAGIPALGKELQELVNGPLKNAVTSGEAVAAMYQTLSAGIGAVAGKLADSKPFMEAALKLSAGTGTEAATTVETLAKVSYAYSISVKQATKTAAELNGVVEQGIVTMPQLAGNIGRVAGVAAQAKIPLQEMLGSIASLTKTMSADDAMTGYVSLLNSIAGQGAQASQAASDLGVQFNTQAVKAKGLLVVLKELYDKSNGNIDKIKEIIPDSNAFAIALSLMTNAFKEAKENTDVIGKKTGDDLDSLFGARQQSLIKQSTALMNGFQEVLVRFGEKFTPLLQPGMDTLRNMLEGLNKMPEPIKAVIGGAIALSQGLEKIQGIFGTVVGIVTQLGTAFIMIRGQSVLFDGELRGRMLISLANVGKAFAAGEGRIDSIVNSMRVFTGSATIQAAATETIAKATSGLSNVNRILTTDVSILKKEVDKLTTAYIDSALAANEASSAQKIFEQRAIKSGASIEGAASDIQTRQLISVGDKPNQLVDEANVLAAAETANMNNLQKAAVVGEQSVIGFQKSIVSAGKSSGVFGQVLRLVGTGFTFVGDAVKGLWAAFGPLIIIFGVVTIAFKSLSELLSFDILGFKSAAKEAEEYTIALSGAKDGVTKLSEAIDAQTGKMKENNISISDRIKQLKLQQDAESDPKAKKLIQEKLNDLDKLEEMEVKSKDKKYGFNAGAYLALSDAYLITFTDNEEKKKQRKKNREKADNIQESINDRNGVYAAEDLGQQNTDFIYQKNIKNVALLKQGKATTEEGQKIFAGAKDRALTGEESAKVLEAERLAFKDHEVVINERVASLSKALELEKDPDRQVAIKQQITQLNESTQAYEKNNKAMSEYVQAQNSMRDAILHGTITLRGDKLKGLVGEQQKTIDKLSKDLKDTKDPIETALLNTQKGNAESNVGVFNDLNKGMSDSGLLQKKQLNALASSYKEFGDHALNVKMGGTFQDLNKMRTDADKVFLKLEDNLDNLSAKAAKSIVDGVKNQKIQIPGTNIAGSVLSPEQERQALDLIKKINEKAAQEELLINTKKLDKIGFEESQHRLRSTQAEIQRQKVSIDNDNILLKVKKENLIEIEKEYGKDSNIYKQAENEIVEAQYEIEKKKYKLVEQGIADRENLLTRSFARTQALTQNSLITAAITQKEAEAQMFRSSQDNNLKQQKLLTDRIQQIKSHQGDTFELQTQMINLQTEYQKQAIEHDAKLRDRQKQNLTNNFTATKQQYQQQIDANEIIANKMQKQVEIQGSKNQLLQTEFEYIQGRVQLQTRLTGDVEKLADIEYRLVEGRIKNLSRTQAFERQQLVVQNQLKEVALAREVFTNKMAVAENIKAQASLKIDQLQAKRENKSAEELKALDLQLEALVEQAKVLKSQESLLDITKSQTTVLAANAEKELMYKQELARDGGAIDLQIAKNAKIVAFYEKQKQLADLNAKQIELTGTIQTNKAEALTKVYERQLQILEAQKGVLESKTNRVAGELQIASELMRTEVRKQAIAQTIAQIKYKSLMQQQEMEKKVLELQILQNKAALEKEKIGLRVQISQNKADTFGAYAEYQKTKSKINATPIEIQAAALNVQAKLETGAALRFSQKELEQKGAIQDFLTQFQRSNLEDSQQLARSQSKMEVISTLPEGRRRRAAEVNLRRDILSRDLSIDEASPDRLNDQYSQLAQGRRVGLAQIFPTSQTLDRDATGLYATAPRVNAPTVASPLGASNDYDEIRKNYLAQMQEFLVPQSKMKPQQFQMPTISTPAATPTKVNTDDSSNASHFGDVSLKIDAINVTVDGGKDGGSNAGDAVKNAILDQLYTLGNKIKIRNNQ